MSNAQAGEPFLKWLSGLKRDALKTGISQTTIDEALSDIQPINRVIELDRKQPEGSLSFAQYEQRVLPQSRINKGRELYRKHAKLLNKVSDKYGVPGNVIVALWGVETSFGGNTGGFKVIPALATLAYDGRRSSFFRKELINALKIIDEGHITHAQMKGSWAGAMGQNQFMPSSFHAYAIDYDGDDRRDIWTSLPDVFASTANYLKQSGWKSDQRWGREIKLPGNFADRHIGREKKKPLREWAKMGITLPGGQEIPVVKGMKAAIVRPGGVGGRAFLVYDNYDVIMKWNRSLYFATSVGLLADQIAR